MSHTQFAVGIAIFVAAAIAASTYKATASISGYDITSHPLAIKANASAGYELECPSPKKPLGGGYSMEDEPTNDFRVFWSRPTAKGWAVAVRNRSNKTIVVTVWVVCASVG
jgi:hypothetical protein